MADIIRFLVLHNQLLEQFLQIVLVLLTLKQPKKKTSPDSRSPVYQKFQLDPLPKLAQLEKKNCEDLLQAHLLKHGKSLPPVKCVLSSKIPCSDHNNFPNLIKTIMCEHNYTNR